jgi:hypothetical protein
MQLSTRHRLMKNFRPVTSLQIVRNRLRSVGAEIDRIDLNVYEVRCPRRKGESVLSHDSRVEMVRRRVHEINRDFRFVVTFDETV